MIIKQSWMDLRYLKNDQRKLHCQGNLEQIKKLAKISMVHSHEMLHCPEGRKKKKKTKEEKEKGQQPQKKKRRKKKGGRKNKTKRKGKNTQEVKN